MSFNRSQAQVACEAIFSCTNHEQFISKKASFESHHFTKNESKSILNSLKLDSSHLYIKAIHSLFEAILSVQNKYYSWAIIKLYYSNYYFLRSSLGIHGYALIRGNSLYVVKAQEGEIPQKKGGKRYQGDHKAVASIYEDVFKQTDILQSNTIEDINPAFWLMNKREQVNYKELEFHDPLCIEVMQVVNNYVDKGKFYELLKLYFDDDKYLYCFQPDHACLALPIKRASLTYEELNKSEINIKLSNEKLTLLTEIASKVEPSSYILTKLLQLPK